MKATRTLLKEYVAKRDFSRTPEPQSRKRLAAKSLPRFVIQKHDATRLHYDFRLEADGVLKSWAVPKGPSTNPSDKRLAMRTEDHPLDYLDFEGVIPEGEYGAGPVIVWDIGTYENITHDRSGKEVAASRAIDNGKIDFVLHGKKLRGAFALVRMQSGGGSGGREQWLLIKKNDKYTSTESLVDASPRSVLSRKTIEQVNGQARPKRSKYRSRSAPKKTAQPEWIQPMLATLIEPAQFNSNDATNWIFEEKLDGYRALAFRDGEKVRLLSRNKLDLGGKFPEVVEAIRGQIVKDFIVDGEIVALSRQRAVFSQLQQRLKPISLEASRRHSIRVCYMIFDLLFLNGMDTRGLPLSDRQKLLSKAIDFDGRVLRTVPRKIGTAKTLLKRACATGGEGLIAKRIDAQYIAGRGRAWLKLKCSNRQEFVIGGYTDPGGSRTGLGALLLGYFDGNRFRFAGKVGTGFSDAVLNSMRKTLNELRIAKSPFEPDALLPRKAAHWVKPHLVGEVAFTEWTSDGKLRHPSFLGLRPDKSARDVKRETPARLRK